MGGGGAGVVGKRERAVSQRIGGRGVRVIVFDRARIDHVAAALAGQRADVNEPIRLRDQIHVMLHQEHGVAGRDETAAHIHDRIALIGVQAGRGLVEHVRHAEEAGAQLRRQTDALHLAAGQALRRPIQAEVRQAELQRRGQRRQNLPQEQILGRILLRVLLAEHLMHPIQRQRAQLINRHARIGDLQRGRVEAAAATSLALARFHIGQGALAQGIRLGLRKRLIEVAGHRAPRALIVALNLIFSAQGLDRDYGALFREEDPVAVFLRQLLPGRIQVIAQVHQNVVEVLAGPGARPGLDGSFLDGEGGIRDHRVLGRLMHHACAVALRTHSLRGIGREGIGV